MPKTVITERSKSFKVSGLFVPIQPAEIEWQGDTPFSTQYQDVYFSTEGAIAQSTYVFIDGNHLIARWNALERTSEIEFNIAETGFGTGLNFLLTWHFWALHAPPQAKLHFISCEKHPLRKNDLLKCFEKWPQLKQYYEQLLAQYPVLTPGYHHLIFSNGRVKLTLMLGEALESYEQLLLCGDSLMESELRAAAIDAWYLDGFSPSKNEAMWSESFISVIAMLSKPGSTLATYTAAAPVKTYLSRYGFTIEKKKGFATKRHMLTAYLQYHQPSHTKKRVTPWCIPSRQILKEKKAFILGGGLAGCYMAYALAKRGWNITLFDQSNAVGSGASGNERAVLFPRLSAYRSPFTQFMLYAFLFALRSYRDFFNQCQLGEFKGLFLLAFNEKERKAQKNLQPWLLSYPELGRLVNSEEASRLCGVPMDKEGLYIPMSGWLNSPDLCHHLIQSEKIKTVLNASINELTYQNPNWCLNDHEAPIVILANGYQLNQFPQSRSLPIRAIRGQMSVIQSSASSQCLNIPLCGEGHVLPEIKGEHYFGASYGLDNTSEMVFEQDDEVNHKKLLTLAPQVNWSKAITHHWAGVRASTPDYLPMVGPVPVENLFKQQYAQLETNANRWIAQAGPFYPGLFACAGFGSRGITTIPLSIEWLASFLNGEMSLLPRHLIQAISPARFLRRDIIRAPGAC